ncbi:retrovirus-related pol polyprotein from transposon TNT 1-94 [Tanacetum coccineum]
MNLASSSRDIGMSSSSRSGVGCLARDWSSLCRASIFMVMASTRATILSVLALLLPSSVKAMVFLRDGMKLLSSGNESVAWITQSGVLQYTRRNILLKEYWSDQAEEGSNYALMAYLSLKSDSEETSCLIHLIVPFSFTGLDEFVNKPVVENRKSDEEVSKVVRKSNDSPIIKDWVSDNYKEIDGGYVAFGGNPKEGKITGKCTIKTATKMRTSGIFKSFITGIENLVDHKVKVIRCDNGTEFKNKEMNQFCEINGSGPDWLFDIDALTRTMNYKPIVAGTQSNGFVGTKASDNACQAFKETDLSKDYILLPLWTTDLPFSKDPKSSQDDGFKPSSNVERKVDEDPRKETQMKLTMFGGKTGIELLVDPDCLLEDYNIFEDDEDVGAEADMNNLMKRYRTKWIFRNKKDERGIVIRNKARLVAQGYTQEEGIDYDEVFALIARIKAIRLFLAYVSFNDFVVYQMDVKSAFLYGKIKEEVYVCQPPGFEDPNFPDRVYKVEKALYGLHQAPRAWYETLSTYLLDNGFQRRKIDKNLFIKRHKDEFYGRTYILLGIISEADEGWHIISQDNICVLARYQVNPKVSHLYAAKTVNRKVQLQALVDGKKIVITESIVRRDLQLEDAEGVDCLPNATIFDQSCIMGYEQSSGPRDQETMGDTIAQTRFENISKTSNDPLSQEKQAPTPTVSSQQPSHVKVQDKGKGKMVEPEPVKKMSKKDLLRLDEELVFKLQAEEEEERLAREKAQQIEEANIAWDDELSCGLERSRKAETELEENLKKAEAEVMEDEEEVAIDVVPLATKPPTIVDWKIHKEGNNNYYKYMSDDVQRMMQHVYIHMLVEKRYPLTPATITDMLNKKLQGRIVGIKRLLDDLRVTAAQVCVTAAKLKPASIKLVCRED